MTATENSFDWKGKNDQNLQENVNVNVRVIAVVPCLCTRFRAMKG
jgi:hypothetical protein